MFQSPVREPTAPRKAPHSLEEAMNWHDAQKLTEVREDSALVNGSALPAQHIEVPEKSNAARAKDIIELRDDFAMSIEDANDATSYTPPQTIATTTALADRLGGIDILFSQGTTADSMSALVRSEKERAAYEDKKLTVLQAKPRFHITASKNKDCSYTCEKVFSLTPPHVFSVKTFTPHCAECVRPDKPTSVYTSDT